MNIEQLHIYNEYCVMKIVQFIHYMYNNKIIKMAMASGHSA